MVKFETELNSIALSPDSQTLLVGGCNGELIETNLKSIQSRVIYTLSDPIIQVMYKSHGSQIVFLSDVKIFLWDAMKNKKLDKWKSHKQFVIVAYNKRFIIISSDFRKAICLRLEKQQIKQMQNYSFINDCFDCNTFSLSPNTNILGIVGVYNTFNSIWFEYLNVKKSNYTTQRVSNLDFLDCKQQFIEISQDYNIIATVTKSGNIDLLSLLNGQRLLRLIGHTQTVECLTFSPTQPILVSGSLDKTIIFWNIQNGNLIKILEGHQNGVTCVAFSKDGKFLASGGLDFIIIIWEVQNFTINKQCKAHQSKIISISFSPDGQIVSSLQKDGMLNFWEISKQIEIQNENLLWMEFKTNNKVLILTNKEILEWNIKELKCQTSIGLQDDSLIKAKYLKKSKELIIYGLVYFRIYDLKNKQQIFKRSNNLQAIVAFLKSNSKQHFNFDYYNVSAHQQVYSTKDKINTVTILDCIQNQKLYQLENYQGYPIASCFSQDKTILALSNWDKSISLWDLQTNSKLNQVKNLEMQINYLKFSQKGDLLACRTFEKVIILLNQNLEEMYRLELPDFCNSDIFISPNSQWIVCEILGDLLIWQIAHSRIIQNLIPSDRNGHPLEFFDFSSCSQYFAFNFFYDKQIIIMNVNNFNVCFKTYLEYGDNIDFIGITNSQQFFQNSKNNCQINTVLGSYFSVREDIFSCNFRCFKNQDYYYSCYSELSYQDLTLSHDFLFPQLQIEQ